MHTANATWGDNVPYYECSKNMLAGNNNRKKKLHHYIAFEIMLDNTMSNNICYYNGSVQNDYYFSLIPVVYTVLF